MAKIPKFDEETARRLYEIYPGTKKDKAAALAQFYGIEEIAGLDKGAYRSHGDIVSFIGNIVNDRQKAQSLWLPEEYIKLEQIACVGADGKEFENYPELYLRKDIFRDSNNKQVSLTPYNAIVNCEKSGLILPSFALTCNILARLYAERANPEMNNVLMQYKNKGNGYGCHAQNTVVNWGTKQIIHYPHDSDFPSNGGTANVNHAQKRIALGFDNRKSGDKTLEDALKIPDFAKYVKNLTGLRDPSVLVEIGKHFGKTARVWVSSSNETRACWLGCDSGYFSLNSLNNLNYSNASRGYAKIFHRK